MVMGAGQGGVFQTIVTLARRGLAGRAGNGRQYVSWIHERDFARSLDFLIDRPEISGPVNICAPNPLPNEVFNKMLRKALHVKFGLPAAKWMLELGALAMGTETELILKSRRVVPGRLIEAGFNFEFPNWASAVADLAPRKPASAY